MQILDRLVQKQKLHEYQISSYTPKNIETESLFWVMTHLNMCYSNRFDIKSEQIKRWNDTFSNR